MTMPHRHASVATAALVLMALGAPGRALADPTTCSAAIARAAAKHLQGLTKAMQRCEDAKARFRLRSDIVCATDPLFDPIRTSLLTKLFVSINLACGGPNEDCGDGDDEPLGPTGWGAVGQCPDVNGAGCTNPISTCLDVAQCLECIDRAAVAQSLDVPYGALDASEFGTNSAVNRCQRAIGKAGARYLSKRAKAMEKCWEARIRGQHSNACPSPGDGKAATQIANAEEKKQAAICRACGGVDRQCNGAGDTSPSDIGFTSSCPAVKSLFPPSSCGGAIVDAASIVDCVDCVADFDADCAGAASVPSIVGALPAACNPSSSTTTTTTAPASTTSSSTASPTTSSTSSSTSSSTTSPAGSTSSSTSSSTTTSSAAPTTSTSSSTTTTTSAGVTTTTILFDFLSTSATGTCGNTFRDLAGTIPLKKLLCGGLSLGGGVSQVPDNSTPSGATNRFTLACVGSSCTIGSTASGSTPVGVDCTDVGCRFGTPLPISNAGLSVCVTNTFSPVQPSGTLDLASGAATWSFQLNSATILTGIPGQPCPICATAATPAGSLPPQTACNGTPGAPCTGKCNGGPNDGLACVSRNPNGLASDCPAPGAAAGVQRCYGGANNELTCSTGANCAGATCAQFIGNIAISLSPLTTGTASLSNASGLFCPGQTATQHGAFNSAICQTGANSGQPCINNTTSSAPDVANCGAGVNCRPGNLSNYCSAGTNNGKGCVTAADCGTGGTCVKAGTVVQLIQEVGVPAGALSVGVPQAIKLGAAFCVGATTNPTVNSNANLPGPGATSVVGTITLLP
jgi:hypothetical protein